MFPIRWNFPFRKKDGSVVNIEDVMSGGGGYTLPTASANTKGGIKIGTGLTMNEETLNVDAQLPEYGIEAAGKVLGVDDNGDLAWVTVSGGLCHYIESTTNPISELPSTDAEEVN